MTMSANKYLFSILCSMSACMGGDVVPGEFTGVATMDHTCSTTAMMTSSGGTTFDPSTTGQGSSTGNGTGTASTSGTSAGTSTGSDGSGTSNDADTASGTMSGTLSDTGGESSGTDSGASDTDKDDGTTTDDDDDDDSVDPTLELVPLDCKLESNLASEVSQKPYSDTIRFENAGNETRRLHWLDLLGRRQLYATLQPGEYKVQKTRTSEIWVISDAKGNCKGIYIGIEGHSQATLR